MESDPHFFQRVIVFCGGAQHRAKTQRDFRIGELEERAGLKRSRRSAWGLTERLQHQIMQQRLNRLQPLEFVQAITGFFSGPEGVPPVHPDVALPADISAIIGEYAMSRSSKMASATWEDITEEFKVEDIPTRKFGMVCKMYLERFGFVACAKCGCKCVPWHPDGLELTRPDHTNLPRAIHVPVSGPSPTLMWDDWTVAITARKFGGNWYCRHQKFVWDVMAADFTGGRFESFGCRVNEADQELNHMDRIEHAISRGALPLSELMRH